MRPSRASYLLFLVSIGCSLGQPEPAPVDDADLAAAVAKQEAGILGAHPVADDLGEAPRHEPPADVKPSEVSKQQVIGLLVGSKEAEQGGSAGLGLRGAGLGAGGRGQSLGVSGVGSGGAGAAYGVAAAPENRGFGKKLPMRSEPLAANTEGYRNAGVNAATLTVDDPLSTFATDVDTGSFTLARRMLLDEGRLPNPDGVRVEEFINYPDWAYPTPTDDSPVGVNLEVAPSPWQPGHHLLWVGLRAQDMRGDREPVSLVFLLDVSGSMSGPDRLPRAKAALHTLVDSLDARDSVAVVMYAGQTGIALDPTPGDQKAKINAAIDALQSSGGTNMSSGVDLAYGLAERTMRPGRENRVIVLSDGDANIGSSTPEALLEQIHGYAGRGITLSTIGFGVGNYQDAMMEQFADKGDGNYYYIDSLNEAKRVFRENLAGTVQTVARDVKVQVEFNPAAVSSWRLVGYENRDVADRDFRNDKVDGGEMGSGQRVTVLYDLVLDSTPEGDLATVSFRAKRPGVDAAAREWRTTLEASQVRGAFEDGSVDFRAAVGIAGLAELLRNSPTAQGLSMDQVASILAGARRAGRNDGDVEQMVARAQALSRLGQR